MLLRTSVSDPLRIAELDLGSGKGLIGITFCPGKKDARAAWDRDLTLDLDTIVNWRTFAIVCLLENHELDLLSVLDVGQRVQALGMVWHHLPIRDVSVPDTVFERKWSEIASELHQIVEQGLNILVHCRGGLGRAGLVAARLLVEHGVIPEVAIARVRSARPGAIETPEQENYVLNLRSNLKP